MKKITFLLVASMIGFNTFSQSSHGEKISEKGAITTQELAVKMADKDAEYPVKVTGTVESVCQAKGCWMQVKLADGKSMRVTFKDYGFFVPKDIAGKTVVMDGKAYVKTTSVKTLKHYAEDAGKKPEEIAKITEPEKALAYEAKGVIVK